jgi:hypothetical protein
VAQEILLREFRPEINRGVDTVYRRLAADRATTRINALSEYIHGRQEHG